MKCICVGPKKDWSPLIVDADTGKTHKSEHDKGRLAWRCPVVDKCSCKLDYEEDQIDLS